MDATISITHAVARHKTAIRRPDLSAPVRCILRDGILTDGRTLLDYGCGYGEDVARLSALGCECYGWDPVYQPNGRRGPADIVNLGYVINVIEDPDERADVLTQAWTLCRSLLVISAISPAGPADASCQRSYRDGVLTSRNTFQKHYSHHELRTYLERHIPVDAVPAAPNVFYLFKSDELREHVLANRFHTRIAVPRMRAAEALFEANRLLLEPLMDSLTQLGRLPGPEELPEYPAIVANMGSLKTAFRIICRATGHESWTSIAARRREDMLVYLALSRFARRVPYTRLPAATQRDIKAFSGSYSCARSEADALLFSVGKPEVIDAACRSAPAGHLVDNALVVRSDALASLEPCLRVFEGCARAIAGEVEGTNVVKLHRFSGKVTYLLCDAPDTDPDPAVSLRVKVDLPMLEISVFDYADCPEPRRLGLDMRQQTAP